MAVNEKRTVLGRSNGETGVVVIVRGAPSLPLFAALPCPAQSLYRTARPPGPPALTYGGPVPLHRARWSHATDRPRIRAASRSCRRCSISIAIEPTSGGDGIDRAQRQERLNVPNYAQFETVTW